MPAQRPKLTHKTFEGKPAQRALATALVSVNDLLRLKAIARLHAHGLSGDVGWNDILQEAILRVLEGKRRQPEGVSIVAFLAGVMRSIRSEYRRRARREARECSPRPREDAHDRDALSNVPDPAPDPEALLATAQQLAAIDAMFLGDLQALQVLAGLGEGLTPEEMQTTYAMSKTDYDSTRKRMRRALLRAGLAWRTS